MKINYHRLCEKQIERLASGKHRPSLLLQSCCGPCSSYVLEYLTRFFDVDVLFYNPNIFPKEEYIKRLETQKKLIEEMNLDGVKLCGVTYNHEEFLQEIKGLESCKEGGERCSECFKLRMRKTAEYAKKMNYDCFTTTLSVSPHKNAELLNEIGEKLSDEFGVEFLVADFKKNEGYKRSIELSKKFDLYRQDFCGCEFSRN